MSKKFYAMVCKCDGNNLKVYENLGYYEMIARKAKKKNLFR